jgi:hypothetical protein
MQVLRVGEQCIIFTMDELQKLHDLFQNPIYDDETAEEQNFREHMFKGFNECWRNSKRELSLRQKPVAQPFIDDDIPF